MATEQELQAQLDEAKRALDEAKKAGGLSEQEKQRLAHLESENKDLISARDKAKAKAREEEEARLLEQGEYKTLAEQLQAEKDGILKQLEERESVLASFNQREEQRFEALKEKVPEDMRDLLTDDIALPKRIELAEKLAATKPAAPTPRLPGEPDDQTLEVQYQQAVKDGNVSAQIALKNQMYKNKG